jgi:uroporphyrinogen decarboxylase
MRYCYMLFAKEVVRKAISFSGPPRIPLVFRTDPDKSDIITAGFGTPTQVSGSQEIDEWNCVWQKAANTGLGQVVRHPLQSWDDFESYEFPNPLAENRFQEIPKLTEEYQDRFIAGGMGISGFNRMFLLRGFENLLEDIYFERTYFEGLADKIFEFEMAIIIQYAKYNIDGIWFFDDWGTETGLFIDPKMWRELFKKRYLTQFDLTHQKGMSVFFHSCGNIWEIIPDLIEIGVDCLNVEQPLLFGTNEIDGISRLAAIFGGKVCFCTNPDSQRTLITGTHEEIESEVNKILKVFDRFNGGLIGLADATRDHGYVPDDNVEAMSDAFNNYNKKRIPYGIFNKT